MGSLVAILSSEATPDVETAKRMLSVAPHRGSRFDFLVHGRCVLGASNSEALPDATLARSDGIAAVVCGTVDNLSELAKRFSAEGPDPTGQTPADVMLSLFRALRDDIPGVLRGMYGAVITDGSAVWCFRDHLAFGQLFYRRQGNSFFAATEAKQVVAGSGTPLEPDVEVVERLFYADVDDDTPCALKGVERLPKSTLLVADGRTARRRRYWDPQALVETARLTPEEIKSRFYELMTQAVDRQLTGSDAISLSGGIDSPTVAAFAAPLHLERFGRPISALSEVYPDYPGVDERKYIEIVCDEFNISLHTFNPKSRPLDGILEWVRLCDSPVPVQPPAEAGEFYGRASKLGFRNVLGGDLAEFVMDRKYGLIPHLVVRGRFSALARQLEAQRARGIPWQRLGRQLAAPFVPLAFLAARERLARPGELFPDWLDIKILNRVNAGREMSRRERWRKEQVAFFVGPGIGLEADEVISAVCGVRPRRPWIDVDLCEFFLSLQAEIKFPDATGKSLVRTLLRGKLPDAIVNRMDKTFFNERLLDRIDYPALRHWLIEPKHRIRGVNYGLLADRLNRDELLHIGDYKWALDLAKTHAFLSLW